MREARRPVDQGPEAATIASFAGRPMSEASAAKRQVCNKWEKKESGEGKSSRAAGRRRIAWAGLAPKTRQIRTLAASG
jgi:hypothetical protein